MRTRVNRVTVVEKTVELFTVVGFIPVLKKWSFSVAARATLAMPLKGEAFASNLL
jgi:hypothetical protein